MNADTDSFLESKLAAFVRAYLRAARDGDSSGEEEALRWTCAGLERLLGKLLYGRQGWNGWVDGVIPATDMLPDAISIISPVELSVRGCALWGETGGERSFWIEPFFGSVRISETNEEITSYELKFADADRGLGRVHHGKHLRRSDWFFPTEWLFTFSKP